MDDQRFFTIKKSILVAFCVIDIIVYIIYASRARHFAEKFIQEEDANQTATGSLEEQEVRTTIRLIVFGSMVGITIQLVGLVGAIRHNLCLSSTYSIAMSVGAIVAIVRAYSNFSRYWVNTSWSLAVAVVALVFLWDLYYRAQVKRLQRRSKKANKKHVIEIDMQNMGDKAKCAQEEQISFIEREKDLFR